ncbi:hypothetical protein N7G274_005269 [Stereocaulon virgatum]|uniref:Uncharacterized protein n=1 Tax=Stereocaulon virgatum TaxID=373712 RepID=A0ABR4AB28_9LECA
MDHSWPVELLKRQYLQLIDPERLELPCKKLLRMPLIQARIFDEILDESALIYLPPERYKSRVLKRLIKALEEAIEDPEEDEISDDISACLAQSMAQPLPSASSAAQQKSYVTYTAPVTNPNAPRITTLEAPSLLASSGTTGFRTWEAALHLGSYLVSEDGNHHVADQRIIELGAGTGFLSILCAKHLGARHVLATDGSLEVVTDIKVNLDLNELEEGDLIKTSVLRWGHALIGCPADCRREELSYDVAIGADVTYDIKSMPALIATMRDLFELYPKLKVLIAATRRNEETLQFFLAACETNGFETERLDFSMPKANDQTGFFHPTSTPIQLSLITNQGARIDPFSLQLE